MDKTKQQNTYPVDTSKLTITRGNPETDLGLSGRVNAYPDYTFSATVFAQPSGWGINQGCISKLCVRDKSQKEDLIHYDRGWVTLPRTHEQLDVLNAIIDGFPNPPEKERSVPAKSQELKGEKALEFFGQPVRRSRSKNRGRER